MCGEDGDPVRVLVVGAGEERREGGLQKWQEGGRREGEQKHH